MSNEDFNEARESDVHVDITMDLEYLLDNNVKALVFYGDMDWICSYENGEKTLEWTKWKGQGKWNEVEFGGM
jgi:carboxypeptidase C (cathepsin A)